MNIRNQSITKSQFWVANKCHYSYLYSKHSFVVLSRFISLITKRVRVAAAESMPLLLECARVRGPEYLTQMWHFMCDALIKAIGTEPDSDVLSEIMHSFAKVTFFFLEFICS